MNWLDSPARRITFAIVVSVLLHALLLWGPDMRLPHFFPVHPTLTARLEPLPGDIPHPPRPAPKKQRSPVSTPPRLAVDKHMPSAPTQAKSPQTLPVIASAPVAVSAVVAASAPAAATQPEHIEAAPDRPPLPKHARLTYDINKGSSNFRVGETVHTLDIDAGQYLLQSKTTTTGIASLFKSYELDQTSSGSYTKYGLQPKDFFEIRMDRQGVQRNAVEFDYAAQLARFLNGTVLPLPPQTQDILSVLYQFPPLSNREITTISISNGRKIEHYEFEIANVEIDTPLGKMLTIQLRKLHDPGEEGLVIWLARDYRLFPVKMRFIDSHGEITGEAIITDIQISDEPGARSDAVN